MGVLAARFFAYVQSAALYRDLHRQAVALLPQGNGLSWLDPGCGPGLVVRYAQKQGYVATGVDIDPEQWTITHWPLVDAPSCQPTR